MVEAAWMFSPDFTCGPSGLRLFAQFLLSLARWDEERHDRFEEV